MYVPAGFNAPAEPPVKPPSPLSAERLASCIEPNFPACSIKTKQIVSKLDVNGHIQIMNYMYIYLSCKISNKQRICWKFEYISCVQQFMIIIDVKAF